MLHFKSRCVAAVLAIMLPCGAAIAEQRPVVIELFTSQGCSSCPPADELLREVSARDEVIALALHVDYWDYIGWKDRFGKPSHAQRQRAYAAAGGRNSVYTPEMVINGQQAIVGARPMKLADAIMTQSKRPQRAKLTADQNGDSLTVSITPLAAVDGPYEVKMVTITPEKTQEITRGENRGKTFVYSNIARSWTMIGEWNGAKEQAFSVSSPGAQPCVILLQKPGAGEIIAAARVN